MQAWGFNPNHATYARLMDAYSKKGRYYHTQAHVTACLLHLDSCVSAVACPREVELALWFHDAIYAPLSAKNEKKSADWASSFLSENGVSAQVITRVYRLIMVTQHNAPTRTKDESILVDIDLSILGADPETYEVFEQQVRKEYRVIPWFLFQKKRAALLQGFLDRSNIYNNDPFSTEREQQARENLSNAISKLIGRT